MSIKSTDIKPFLVNDTGTRESQKEMMDTEKRELERKVSINLRMEFTQHGRKSMSLFLRRQGSKLNFTIV